MLVVAGAAVVLSWYRFKDPDGFYHLKIGQLILEQGALLRTNTLSNLFADYPWNNPEWLFQILLALAHRLGGWVGVAILKSSLVLALALAVYVMARRQEAGRVASVALTLTLLSVDRFRMTERPHLVSHLFFALTVLLVEEHRRRRGRLGLLALPPLFAVWSNFH
ncbi:MAG TPA: hypothetical protein VN317_07785, partial [Candidatus Methanoperedens sp.]|nr:hypothetical protein [Candidatus Methanoperedens sp.]